MCIFGLRFVVFFFFVFLLLLYLFSFSFCFVSLVFQTSALNIESIKAAFDTAITIMIYPIDPLIIDLFSNVNGQNSRTFYNRSKSESHYKYSSQKHLNEFFQYFSQISAMYQHNTEYYNHYISNLPPFPTEKFLFALRRIFHILDKNYDFLLEGTWLCVFSFGFVLHPFVFCFLFFVLILILVLSFYFSLCTFITLFVFVFFYFCCFNLLFLTQMKKC